MPCANKASSSLLTFPAPTPVWADWPWPEWLYFISRCYCHMRERRRQCNALLQLDDHLLADIGVSREQALHEAGKWFSTR